VIWVLADAQKALLHTKRETVSRGLRGEFEDGIFGNPLLRESMQKQGYNVALRLE
jgi:hypothetical protein